MKCYRCFITGRVQDVAFRVATRQHAQKLGLSGYARNMTDGRVEVYVCGDAMALHDLCQWLWVGPPLAKVTVVECQEVEHKLVSDFIIG